MRAEFRLYVYASHSIRRIGTMKLQLGSAIIPRLAVCLRGDFSSSHRESDDPERGQTFNFR